MRKAYTDSERAAAGHTMQMVPVADRFQAHCTCGYTSRVASEAYATRQWRSHVAGWIRTHT